MRKLRKGAAALLCVLMLVGLLPITALAAVGMQNDTPTFMVNDTDTVIHFAGHEWYVIDTGTNGVTNPGSGSLTLLAKSSFGTSAFRIGQNNQPADTTGWNQYSGDSWWYQGAFSQPNDYNDSTLMRALATATDALPQNEAAQIAERDFTTADGIGGDAVANQMLWPLSDAEYFNMETLTGDAFSGNFWLRSPFLDNFALVGIPGGGNDYLDYVYYPYYAVRPALHLNLASVLFTSAASDTSGKSTATVGSGLIGAQAPSQNLKFTFSDGTSAPTVTFAGTTDGTSTLRFGYSGANTGTNQYLSCVLINSSNAVAYYGKLADCAATASGVFSIDTSTLTAGSYTLKVYSEQANGNTNSDFASDTANFTLVVDGSGNGTITGGTPDDTAPTVSNVTPGGVDVPVSGNIVITFSEAMNPAAGVGEVKLNSGTALTGGSWTSGTTYTVPYSGLTASTAYTVIISGFQDAVGNDMDANNTNGFTTAAQGVTLYTLTVASGTGGGSYAAGAQVPIQADAAPAGQVFDKWTGGNGGTFANANSASTTFTMPAGDATVTATYKTDGGNNGSDPGPGAALAITDYSGVYDGAAHSIEVTNTIAGDTVEYSTDGGTTWSTTNPAFTNVGVYAVDVKVTNDNYAERRGTGTVTITARPITITAASDSKVYDGDPLTNAGYTLTSGTLAGGDTLDSVEVTGTQTDVGTSANVASAAVLLNGTASVTSNYDVSYVAGSLEVTDATGAALAITDYSGVYDGAAHSIEVTNTIAGDTVEYSTDGGTTWSTTNPAFTNVGVYAVDVKVTNDNYAERRGTGTVTITARPITITAASDSKVYDGDPLTNAGYTLTSGTLAGGDTLDSVEVTGTQTDVGTSANVASAAVLLNGTASVTSNYDVSYVAGSLEVTDATGAALAITDYSGVYDGAAHSIEVTNTIAGDTVEYSTDGGTTWSTTNPAFTNVGVYAVDVKVTNDNYAERRGTGTVTITARPITITAASDSKVYDGDPLTNAGYTLTSGTLAGGDTLDSVEVTGTQTDVGTSANVASAAVLLNGTASVTSNYDVSYVAGSLEVTDATGAALAITDYSGVYDGAAHSIEVTNTIAGDTVEYSTDGGTTWSTTNPAFTNVGVYAVDVKVTNDNYAERRGTGTVTITARPITITAASDSKVYDGDPLTNAGYTLTSGTLAGGDTLDSVEVTGTQTDVGTSANVASAAVLLNGTASVTSNYDVSYVAGSLEVTDATGAALAITDYSGVYDGAAHSIEVTNTIAGDTVEYSTDGGTTWSTTNPAFTNVGVYAVDVKVTNDNYAERRGTGTVTITARPITITAASDSKVYDGDPLTNAGYTLTSGTLAGGDTLDSVEVTGTQTDVGTSANVASAAVLLNGTASVTSNYDVSYVAGSLEVTDATGAALAITDYSGVYDGAAHSIEVTNTIAGDTVEYSTDGGTTWSTTNPAFTNVGVYAVDVKVTNDNYAERRGTGTVTITARPITITAASDSKVYDGDPLTNAGYTLTSGTLAGGDTLDSVEVTGTQTDVGTSANVASAAVLLNGTASVTSNYDVSYVAGSLEVTDATGAALAITDYSGVYDGAAHSIEVTNTIAGDTVEYSTDGGTTWSTTNPAFTNVGVYAVDVKVTNDNYAERRGTGTVTITARPITITAASDSKVYDGDPLTNAGYTLTSGTLAGGDTLDSVEVTGTQTDVGTSANVASAAVLLNGTASVTSNYDVSYVAGSLEVTDATGAALAITDYSGVYDGAAHSIEVTNTIAGDTVEYSTDGGTTWSTTNPAFTNVGVYAVDVKVTNDNYAERRGTGTVTITARPITITAASDSKVYDGDPLTNAGYTLTSGTLAGGDTLDSVEVTGTQTDVGTSANVASAAVLLNGTASVTSNYDVSYVAGSLEVTDATGAALAITDYSGVYDGAAHSIEVTNTIAGDTVEYSTDGGTTWSTTNPAFTNVGVYAVDVKVTNDNYAERRGTGTVTITARPITITAASDSKVYDGDPLTNAGYTLTSGTLAGGDTLDSVEVTGTQTDVGTSANVASAAVLLNGTASVTSNYDVSYVAGSLEVTDATGAALAITDYSGVYDGAAHSIEVTNTIAGDTVEYSTDGGTTWSTTNPAFTNVGVYAVDVKVTNDNYAERRGTGTVTITARPITITAASDSKVYDGDPLTNAGYTLTSGTLAGGDTLDSVEVTGTQTDVGTSANVASAAVLLNGTASVTSNYDVSYVAGSLEVTQLDAPSLAIIKQAENLTRGDLAADTAFVKVGETVRFKLEVTNDGNVNLTDVYLTDNEAVVGNSVEINGTVTTWLSGPGGVAMIHLGDMVPGEKITIIYDYIVVKEDEVRKTFTNTATAYGAVKGTADDPDGQTVQISDYATATVEIASGGDAVIPTGEQNNTVFAWGLILMGLGWILTTQRRRFRKGNED